MSGIYFVTHCLPFQRSSAEPAGGLHCFRHCAISSGDQVKGCGCLAVMSSALPRRRPSTRRGSRRLTCAVDSRRHRNGHTRNGEALAVQSRIRLVPSTLPRAPFDEAGIWRRIVCSSLPISSLKVYHIRAVRSEISVTFGQRKSPPVRRGLAGLLAASYSGDCPRRMAAIACHSVATKTRPATASTARRISSWVMSVCAAAAA